MQRWRGVQDAPAGWGRSVVTIGVFDGVHRGHQRIIRHTVERARDLGVASVVVTFDPHPSEVVRPGSHPAVLTEPARKAELIEELGVDVLCVIPFTVEFSRLSPETFVHDVLVEHLHASEVVVGENFRFGHKAAGDVELLRRLGRTFGFTVESAHLVGGSEQVPVVSSTYIRSCVDAGDVEAAAAALGRPHRLEGIVIRGDGRGRELDFPTANLMTSAHAAVPADGVYAAWAILRTHKEPLRAAVSVGTNPTFAGRERRVEAYLLDFAADIYGERLALDFVARLREMRRYDGVAPLVEQIRRDVEQTRALLETPPGSPS
ncbi:MAG TPA: bifunctional riboflavin kinase/FAD synthetase [Micromonosporaceae bacterium]|nr:bifunctional riboflavin kinase/FAD synthetase [Micromonosporaceae bacterium]